MSEKTTNIIIISLKNLHHIITCWKKR